MMHPSPKVPKSVPAGLCEHFGAAIPVPFPKLVDLLCLCPSNTEFTVYKLEKTHETKMNFKFKNEEYEEMLQITENHYNYLKLSENLQSLFDSGKHADVILLVGTRELRVHKLILIARSPVFAAMFEHDCEERRINRITITDVAGNVFDQLIRYIYSGNVDSLDKYASDLLMAADKYQIDSLKSICEQYLIATLNIESVCATLLLAKMYKAFELELKCMDYISDNATKVMNSKDWKVLKDTKPELGFELFRHLAQKINRWF